jgi:adenylate cyclase class IV
MSVLGCKLEPEWEFVATGMIYSPLKQINHLRGTSELDDIYECASEDVSTNNMELRIRLEKLPEQKYLVYFGRKS